MQIYNELKQIFTDDVSDEKLQATIDLLIEARSNAVYNEQTAILKPIVHGLQTIQAERLTKHDELFIPDK